MKNNIPAILMVLGGLVLLFPVSISPPPEPDIIVEPDDGSFSPESLEDVTKFSVKLWSNFFDKVKATEQYPDLDWVRAECDEIFEKPWLPFVREVAEVLPLTVADRNAKLDAIQEKWFSSFNDPSPEFEELQ